MQLSTYLHFNGTCAEAMRFYAKVFRAPEPEITPQPDNPAQVMHALLTVTPGGTLMGSDYPQRSDHAPQQSVSISVRVENVAEGRRLFDAFADDGDVVSPFEATSFSPGFGVLRDRFGTQWMINTVRAS